MLTLNQFWQIINTANEDANHDITIINENVLNALVKLDNDDIVLWQRIFEEYYTYAEGNQLHVAFYIIDGSYNSLAFDSYRAGLISFGETIYMRALRNPDNLADYDFIEANEMLNAAFLSVAKIAYIMKNDDTTTSFDEIVTACILTGKLKKEIYESIDFSMKMDDEWEDSERSLKRLCPNLFDKFW